MPVNETNSQASSGPSYGVFLSFRGPDTRHGFTDCLYHAMVDAGIHVFRDDESLRVGERISDELLQAIENSKIYIPIFSKNYAASHWCLRELAHMVDCTSKSNENKKILPIFLDVEPDDVKLKTKLYKRALSKHQRKFCVEAVESWKKALIEVDEKLDARGCRNLTGEIPKEIGRLSRLRNLSLSDTPICRLPTTVSHLSNLQKLKLENCAELKQLPELPPSLSFLTWGCEYEFCPWVDIGAPSQQETPVITLPTNIGSLSQLKTLTLNCKNVQFLPQLPSSLRQLNLHSLVTTRSPDFSNLKDLSFLTFDVCSLELSWIFDAESEYLRMGYCKFRVVDAPLEMKRLRTLKMDNCSLLPEVLDLSRMKLDLSRMKNLEEVKLRYCDPIVEICGLEELGSLCSLTVEHCLWLKRISDLSKLKKLPKLNVGGNSSLNKQEIYWNYWNGEFGGDICNVGGFDLSFVPDKHKVDVFFGSPYPDSDFDNDEEFWGDTFDSDSDNAEEFGGDTFGLPNLSAAHKVMMLGCFE